MRTETIKITDLFNVTLPDAIAGVSIHAIGFIVIVGGLLYISRVITR